MYEKRILVLCENIVYNLHAGNNCTAPQHNMPNKIQRKMCFSWKTIIIHQTFKTPRFIFWGYCVCQIGLPRSTAFIDWWESPPPPWRMSLLACCIPGSLPFQGCVYNKMNFISYLWFQQWMVIENGWKYCAIALFWPLLVPWNKILVQLHSSELLWFLQMDENIGAIAFF